MRVESEVRTPRGPGCHGNRVALVLWFACGWEHDEGVGRWTGVELDDRRARRRAPEDGAVDLAREERAGARSRVTVGPAPGTARPIAPVPA